MDETLLKDTGANAAHAQVPQASKSRNRRYEIVICFSLVKYKGICRYPGKNVSLRGIASFGKNSRKVARKHSQLA